MDRNRKIIITIIICLLMGNVVFALATGEREPFLYVMNNKMNYDVHGEEIDVAENEPVTLEDEMDFSTEATTKQKETNEKTTEQITEQRKHDGNEKKDGNKKPVKKSDKNSDKKSTEEGEEGDNEEGGDDNSTQAKKLVELICTWKNSDKLLYGRNMNIADIHVTGKYDNGDNESIPIENCTISGFNSKKLGKGTCTISYYGLSKDVSYNILNYELSIFCESWNKRYQYRYGDEFANSDIIITANMADGSKENIKEFNVSGMQMKSVGEHVCTISYKDFVLSEGYIINNYPVSINSSIKKFTVRGDVPWDDIASGQKFTADMADGSVKDLSADEYKVSGYSSKTAGDMELTVNYDGVSMTVPYVVYYDSLKVNLGTEIGKSTDIHFTTTLEVVSASSLSLDEEYTDKESGTVYILEGVYLDSGYKNEIDYPKTYTANKKFRINSEGLPWHEYTLYAKYIKKISEKE